MTQAGTNEGVGVGQRKQKAGRDGGTAAMLAGCGKKLLKQETKIHNTKLQQSLKIRSISKREAYYFLYPEQKDSSPYLYFLHVYIFQVQNHALSSLGTLPTITHLQASIPLCRMDIE